MQNVEEEGAKIKFPNLAITRKNDITLVYKYNKGQKQVIEKSTMVP